jgi:glycerate 2-kinase
VRGPESKGIQVTQRVLIAADKFKGSLTAVQVAERVTAGLRRVVPDLEVEAMPVADGGDGTVDAAVAAGFERREVRVAGPLGHEVTAAFALRGDTAVVEMAEASGLQRLPAGAFAPLTASTYGSGELLRAALDAGARTIVFGVGGSATTDGGAGAVAALQEAGARPALTVICDVRVPFEDCARVFGPQKGADPEMVERLTRRLHQQAEAAPRDPRGRPMTGAAGGLSGGLWAHCGAELVAGARFVLDAVALDARLEAADAVVSGEGRLDDQTLTGKAIAELAARSRVAGKPLHVVAGTSTLTPDEVAELGLAGVREASTLEELRAAGRALAADVKGARGGPAARPDPEDEG